MRISKRPELDGHSEDEGPGAAVTHDDILAVVVTLL